MGLKQLSELKPGDRGLVYLRGDGQVLELSEADLWQIALRDGEVQLSRYCGGLVNETYRHMSPAEGAVAVAAIIQGFEPPRALRCRDEPVR